MQHNYPFTKEYGEVVSPGHPDKLADAIADDIVGSITTYGGPLSLVGVEVAISLNRVFVTGRIASKHDRASRMLNLKVITDKVYENAGYGKSPNGFIWSPALDKIKIDDSGLIRDSLLDGEDDIRQLSDDQSITVGYAVNSLETNYIPRAQWLAWQLLQEIQLLTQDRDIFGPDAKIMTEVENNNDKWSLTRLVCSMQHNPNIDWSDLSSVVYQALDHLTARFLRESISCEIDVPNIDLIINGHGDFSTGGPMGDNGLSGKKLVMDAYGPMIPIGGGAYSGKDPHKVDRVGPVLARELALKSLIENNLSQETVSLTWAPGHSEYTSLISTSGKAKVLTNSYPKNINQCFSRYFSDENLRKQLKEFALKGWYSGRLDAPWEKIIKHQLKKEEKQ